MIGTAYQKVAIFLAAAIAMFQCMLVDVAPMPWLCQVLAIAHIALLGAFAWNSCSMVDEAVASLRKHREELEKILK